MKAQREVIDADIAVRAYVAPGAAGTRPTRPRPGSLVVVLDTETRVELGQDLLFGSYRIYNGSGLVREGIVHAEDLGATEMDVLRRYVRDHRGVNGRLLPLLTRSEFVEEVIWELVYKRRALLVGFNLAWDISRLAVASGTARNGGFSLTLFQYSGEDGELREHFRRPRITVKSIGSKRQFLSFTVPATLEGERRHEHNPGRFLDLHMATFALTDESRTLDGAAELFGVRARKEKTEQHGVITPDYVGYNRQDVAVTYGLYRAIVNEWARHPVDEPVEQLYSPASVGKGYMREMGIGGMLERSSVPELELGHHMVAYSAGRAECRIRGVPMPVRYVDLTSQYPTVFVLLGLWKFVTAARLTSADATADARRYLARFDREQLLDQRNWPPLATVICRVQPDFHLLPTRSKYGAVGDDDAGVAWTMGLNYLGSTEELWFTLADLVVAKLLDGRAPEVLEARRIVPGGTMKDLRRVALRGDVEVDPERDDFFKRVIEERQAIKAGRPSVARDRLEHFLKTLASATAYGLFAEFRTFEPKRGKTVEAFGLESLRAKPSSAEEAGEFCFPPLAATITGAGRLLLALVQAEVEAAGGSYVGTDTDALLVVASPEGGLVACPGGTERLADGTPAVRALTDDALDGIVARLDRLNPYDRSKVSPLLKLEKENFRLTGEGDEVDRSARVALFGLQISSKRYVLYERTPAGPRLRKSSKHGLGLYRPPKPRNTDLGAPGWIDAAWDRIVREVEGQEIPPPPDWFELPACSEISVSTPRALAPFRAFNQGRRTGEQVKPFGFLLAGHADPLCPVPSPLRHGHVVPVAPYETDLAEALGLPWIDRSSGLPIKVTTSPGGEPRKVRLRTYGEAVRGHRWHPEAKSGDPAGGPGVRASVGLLPRLYVEATRICHIGKEANRLDDVEDGLVTDVADVYVEYDDEAREWRLVREQLLSLRDAMGGTKALARLVGIPERTLRSNLNTGRLPRRDARAQLRHLVSEGPSQ